MRAEEIIEQVCQEFGVAVEDVKGPRRIAAIARARNECYRRLYFETNLTWGEIAGLLNRKCGSTASRGAQKASLHGGETSQAKMDPVLVVARDLPEAWYRCIREVLLRGYEYRIDKGSFEGHRRKEFDLVVVQVEHPNRRPLSPSVPAGVPAPATDADIELYLLYLMTSERQPNEAYTYGEDLEPQIEEVIRRYKSDGFETNQLCMSIGSRDSLKLEYPQCLRLVDTRIRYGALHFVVYFRSWDLYAGFPVNMGGLQLLKEYMASQIGVNDGELIAVSKGLHLYDYCWEPAKAILGW